MHRLRSAGLRLRLAVVILAWLVSGAAAASAAEGTMLRAAWVAAGTGFVDAEPRRNAAETPVDLGMLFAVAARADLGVSVVPMGRAEAEAALRSGAVDLLMPAADADTPSTIPYRTEHLVLLCARGLAGLDTTGTPALAEAYSRGWRLAAVRDAPYRADLAALMAAPPQGRTLHFGDVASALEAVTRAEADCIVAPRLAILATLATMPNVEKSIARGATDLGGTELRMRLGTDLAAETVAALDGAIAEMTDDGALASLEAETSRPILVRFAVATSWFGWLDIVGTVAFALSGVLIARAEKFSLLGAFVLAGLPAVGGGVVRDLLVGRQPIGILADSLALKLVVATVLAAYVSTAIAGRLGSGARGTARRLPKALSPLALLEVTDAIGLAAFTVTGVAVAVRYGAEPLWLWGPFAAALSGAGGGILRDLLRTGYENPALRTSFYAEVCVLWGLALTLAILFLLRVDQPMIVRISVALTVLGAFATRIAVVVLKVRSPRF